MLADRERRWHWSGAHRNVGVMGVALGVGGREDGVDEDVGADDFLVQAGKPQGNRLVARPQMGGRPDQIHAPNLGLLFPPLDLGLLFPLRLKEAELCHFIRCGTAAAVYTALPSLVVSCRIRICELQVVRGESQSHDCGGRGTNPVR